MGRLKSLSKLVICCLAGRVAFDCTRLAQQRYNYHWSYLVDPGSPSWLTDSAHIDTQHTPSQPPAQPVVGCPFPVLRQAFGLAGRSGRSVAAQSGQPPSHPSA